MTSLQSRMAGRNIQKAQAAWQAMTSAQRAASQPEGRRRARPGTKGEGDYYRVVVRPKSRFVTFRTQDVGQPGHLQRLAGQRPTGTWADQAWLISKQDAQIRNDHLVPTSPAARHILAVIGPVKRVRGDIFQGHARRNIPESQKPTPAQRRAWRTNIRKAQQARQEH